MIFSSSYHLSFVPACADGPERVWGQRIIGLGMRVGYPTAAAAIPWIANRYGWRAVPYLLGGPMAVFSLFWHFFATERPNDGLESETELEGSPPLATEEPKKEKAMEWRIFSVPAIQGAMACHIAANNLGYCFLQWTPTYYNEVLKVSNVAAGWLISFPVRAASPIILFSCVQRCKSDYIVFLCPALDTGKQYDRASVVKLYISLQFCALNGTIRSVGYFRNLAAIHYWLL
eukprot:SAG31_NODE_1276_length_9044_cov_10.002236_5_plen_231_part_00